MAYARDSGSDFHSGIVGVGGIVQWRIVVKDGRIVEVMDRATWEHVRSVL